MLTARQLVHIVEQNTANYPHYCDRSQPYGCLPLLTNPWMVQNDAVSWKTAIWHWMTQSGPGPMTAHNAMVGGHGFRLPGQC